MDHPLNGKKLLADINNSIESNDPVELKKALIQYSDNYMDSNIVLAEPFVALLKSNPQLAEVFLETYSVDVFSKRLKLPFEDAVANLPADDLPPRIKSEAQQLSYAEEMIRAIENKDLDKANQLIQDGLQTHRSFVYNNQESENFALLAIRANAPEIFKEMVQIGHAPNPFADHLLDHQMSQRQENAFQVLMNHHLDAKRSGDPLAEKSVKAIYHAAVENNMFHSPFAKASLFRELPNVFSVDDINALVKKGLPIETSFNGQTHTLAHGMIGHKAYPNEVKSFLKTLTDNGFDLNKPDYTGRSFIETVSQVSFGAPRFSDWKEGTDNFLKENPQFNLNVEKKKELSFKP